jgi:HAD superfamily hydrolase (TIGR01484 family)
MVDTAIILAGGLGTRLRPYTETTPKPLLSLKGKPIIQHIMENLRDYGIKNIILSIGYRAETIQRYFGDGSKLGLNLTYSIETEPLGTGGAIKKASQNLKDSFIALNGDNLADFNYDELIEAHQKNRADITLTLYPVEDVTQYGIAELNGRLIKRFIEKPSKEEAPSNLNNAGAYLISPQALSCLPEGKSSIEKDCFEKLAPLGRLGSYIHHHQWFPTDNLDKFKTACLNFRPKINFSEKKVIIADVDETICETCQVISPEIAEEIDRLIKKGYTFAFISGTHLSELKRMVSSKLKETHHHLATTGTNYSIITAGDHKTIYDYSLTEKEKQEITAALNQLIERFNIRSMTTKEDQLQDRCSQITLSAIGRNAPIELKKAYDPDGKKRLEWKDYLSASLNLDKYEIKIGGTTSLDITKKGLDKRWGIEKFAQHHNFPLNSILFIGDKLYPGGNDYAASQIVDCLAVRNPQDTLAELKRL